MRATRLGRDQLHKSRLSKIKPAAVIFAAPMAVLVTAPPPLPSPSSPVIPPTPPPPVNSSPSLGKGWARGPPSGSRDGVRMGVCGSERYEKAFPMIAESARRRSKPFRVRFPINSSQSKFAVADSFPLEEIGHEVVKVKSIPISFRWTSNGDPAVTGSVPGNIEVNTRLPVVKGPTRQRPWFRPPPKVRIVPGILGRRPGEETRVEYQDGGERKVSDEAAYGHRPLPLSTDGLDSHCPQIILNPNPSPPLEPPNPIPSNPKPISPSLSAISGEEFPPNPLLQRYSPRPLKLCG